MPDAINASIDLLSKGLEKKYPCAYLHFIALSRASCSTVSTPSPIRHLQKLIMRCLKALLGGNALRSYIIFTPMSNERDVQVILRTPLLFLSLTPERLLFLLANASRERVGGYC